MIRAVYLRVTIDAAADQKKRAWVCASGQPLRGVKDRGVTRTFVTGLAEKGRPHLQERRLRRTVRIVTVAAVLRYRLMFPQERTAELGMTGSAGFVDGVPHQLCRRARSVG